MKKKIGVKVIAFLALFGIIISVIGTGILVFFSYPGKDNVGQNILNSEEIQKIIDSGEIKISTGSIDTQTGSQK